MNEAERKRAMRRRYIIAALSAILCIVALGLHLHVDLKESAFPDESFLFASMVLLSFVPAALFGTSQLRREVVLDGKMHRVFIFFPNKRAEFVRKLSRDVRRRVYSDAKGIKSVTECLTGIPYVLWWEALGPAGEASDVDARVFRELFPA